MRQSPLYVGNNMYPYKGTFTCSNNGLHSHNPPEVPLAKLYGLDYDWSILRYSPRIMELKVSWCVSIHQKYLGKSLDLWRNTRFNLYGVRRTR
jgi:hypothetical protein